MARAWPRITISMLAVSRWRASRGSDRKSTRLNSSHLGISYAVFCLKKKKYQSLTAGGEQSLCNLLRRRRHEKRHHSHAVGGYRTARQPDSRTRSAQLGGYGYTYPIG